jgi:adenosine deaminase
VVERIEGHPLRRMLDAGLLVTVNSDDPAYFGGYIDDNYQAVRAGLGLDGVQLRRLAENSFRAAFLDAGTRDRLLEELGAFSPLGS